MMMVTKGKNGFLKKIIVFFAYHHHPMTLPYCIWNDAWKQRTDVKWENTQQAVAFVEELSKSSSSSKTEASLPKKSCVI